MSNTPPVEPTLMTFTGATLSGAASGFINLNSDLLYSPISSINIPRGLQLKIWGIRVSGTQIVVAVNFAKNISGMVISSVVHDYVAFLPAAGSPQFLEKNKPIKIPGLAGGESIYLTYQQSATQAPSFIEIDAELSEL